MGDVRRDIDNINEQDCREQDIAQEEGEERDSNLVDLKEKAFLRLMSRVVSAGMDGNGVLRETFDRSSVVSAGQSSESES